MYSESSAIKRKCSKKFQMVLKIWILTFYLNKSSGFLFTILSEATQLLGVITASLNLDVKNDTKSDADTAKKAKVSRKECQQKKRDKSTVHYSKSAPRHIQKNIFH